MLVGALIAYGLSAQLDLILLLPFAAGSFIYIALADLVPELTTAAAAHNEIIYTLGLTGGLAVLLAVAQLG